MSEGCDATAEAGREDAAAPPQGESGSEEVGGASEEQRAGTEEERVRAVIDELRQLRVEDLALDVAVSLVTVGYQKLGLTDQTRELRDLDGARLSIELLRACLDVLERERGAKGLGDLRGTLASMQLNYARAVVDARGGEAPAPEAEATSAGDPDAEPREAPAPEAGTAADE